MNWLCVVSFSVRELLLLTFSDVTTVNVFGLQKFRMIPTCLGNVNIILPVLKHPW